MYRGKIKHIKEKLIDSLQFSSELVFLNDINGAELDDGYKIFFNAVVDFCGSRR